MMYEMLSGHLPFDADDVVEVAIKQISDQPRSLRELAPWCRWAGGDHRARHGKAARKPLQERR